MTTPSKPIPPDESFKPVADFELKAMLDHARLKGRPLSVRAILELQSLRSRQPDREAVEAASRIVAEHGEGDYEWSGGLEDDAIAVARALLALSTEDSNGR